MCWVLDVPLDLAIIVLKTNFRNHILFFRLLRPHLDLEDLVINGEEVEDPRNLTNTRSK